MRVGTMFIALVLLICLNLLTPFASQVRAAWYNSGWTGRVSITINHGQVGSGGVTNFPVYINLASLPAAVWSAMRSDCGDIRVTASDGTTEVPREVVTCNGSVGSQTGELWFKAPSLSSSADTTFYIYYGNASASDYAANATYGAQNVWDSSFVGVWHLSSILNTNDSTVNANNASNTGGLGAISATGEVNGARKFNGTSNYLSVANAASLNITSTITMSAWVNVTSQPSSYAGIISKDNCSGLSCYEMYLNSSTRAFSARIGNGTVVWAGVPVGSWVFLTVTYTSGTGGTLYLNGTQTVAAFGNIGTIPASASPLYIGATNSTKEYTPATIDEVRLSKVVRSAAWVQTEYANETAPATFYTLAFAAPTPNPMTFASPPAATSVSSIAMTAAASTDSYKYSFAFSPCGSDGGTGGASSGWSSSASFTNTGLQVNQCYGYTVQAENGVTNTASAVTTAYTLANTPGAPYFAGWNSNGAIIYNTENGNPANNPTTLFALLVSAPADSNWNGKYTDASGNPSASPVWLSDAQLDGLTLRGMLTTVTYTASAEARNQNGVITLPSPSGSTASAMQAPGTPITGWAWTDGGATQPSTLGWMVLNCTSDPTKGCTTPYGLGVDSSHNITGYAWSDYLGWVSAYTVDTASCGSGNAAMVQGTSVVGYLRAVSYPPGQGCIKLNPTGTSQDVTLSNNTLTGYAWGTEPIGWVQFSAQAVLTPPTCTMYPPSPASYYQMVPPANVTLTYSLANGPTSASITNAPSCTVNVGTTNTQTCSITAPTTPGSYTYTLNASNSNGLCTPSGATVTVASGWPPPTGCISINANNQTCTAPVARTLSLAKNKSATLYWTVSNVAASNPCSLTANGISVPGAPTTGANTAGYSTGAITGRTQYQLSCTALNGTTFTDQAVINMLPVFKEI